jgi:hypothetical protein
MSICFLVFFFYSLLLEDSDEPEEEDSDEPEEEDRLLGPGKS